MPDQQKTQLRLEIAHVLFMDIVGYSKLLIDEQSEALQELNELVRKTDAVRGAEAAGQLLFLPTGDGMALVFTGSVEEPVECALQISQALRAQPNLPVRMGIHSGPAHHIADVNQRANIAGAGINIAQRVMDCGDAGHILLSKRVADDLVQYRRWQSYLHEVGDLEVKHGVVVSLVNLYGDGVGNSKRPAKFKQLTAAGSPTRTIGTRRIRWPEAVLAVLLLAALIGTGVFFSRRNPSAQASVSPKSSAPVAGGASVTEKSIAVLPFENLSSDKENAYFADGVQDEILTNLAKIADLKVISRTSVMQYRSGAARNLRKIGEELGVAHLLEGSVQRVSGKVRVNAQLIDALTDAHLWAQTYDRDLADVFAIQSEIAKAIADQLQAKLSPAEKAAIEQAPTADLVANALYVQARELSLLSESEQENLLKAVRLLEQAVARDPRFVRAYCLLGRVHLKLFWGGYDHTPARRELANAAIQNAFRLQPDSGEVHLALAAYALQGFRDYDRARAELDIARRTLPNDPDVYFWNGVIDRRQGRWAEAVRNFRRTAELDPQNAEAWDAAGATYHALRQYAEAREMSKRVMALNPRSYWVRMLPGFQALDERADIRPLHSELAAIVAEEPGTAGKIADVLFRCALFERDPAAASRALAAIPAEGIVAGGNFVSPREWFAGVAARAFGDNSTAQASFSAARAIEEKIVHDQPDYAPAWSLLGRIDAALGRKDDAIREGRRACELMPVSQDAYSGPSMITHLGAIYAWTGEKALAIEQLTTSAQLPAGISYGELKLDPEFDSLRGDPRYEKIVACLAPKE